MSVCNWSLKQYHHSFSELDPRLFYHIGSIIYWNDTVAFYNAECSVRLLLVALWSDCWETAWSQREEFCCIQSWDGEEVHCHHHCLQGQQEEQGGGDPLQNRSVDTASYIIILSKTIHNGYDALSRPDMLFCFLYSKMILHLDYWKFLMFTSHPAP